MSASRVLLIGALGFLAGLVPARPQSGLGAIRGQVTDPAGASIPGAVVSANNGHGVCRSATADVRGQYVLPNLPSGTYAVRVSAKGFAAAQQTDIVVSSGAAQALDFSLSIARKSRALR